MTRPESLLRRLRRRPSAVAAALFLLVLVIAVVFAPLLAPYDPSLQNLPAARLTPTPEHWLGTDDLGRDILSRLMYGGAPALGGALLAVCVAAVVGTPLGMVAGYSRGPADTVISRIADAFQALPTIIVLMAVIGAFGNSTVIAMTALGVAFSDGFIRLARATTLQVRRELYVDAATVAGVQSGRILARHILPSIRGPLVVHVSITMGAALLIQAGLGFLGLGTPPPTPSWGGMIDEASKLIYLHPWMLVPTGVVMILSILSFNLIGDALATDRPGRSIVRVRPRTLAHQPVADQPVAQDPAAIMPDDAVVRVKDLSVSFSDTQGRFAVVQNVSFAIARGETVGLVGESGSGKSVTARALLGMIAPGGAVTSGAVEIDGLNVVHATPRQLARVRGRKIALVSQEPMVALDPTFTIGAQLRELITHHTGLKGSKARARALELLAMVGIPDPEQAAASYTFQISGGMAQRAAIALALTGEPEVLVADEPTTALDVTVQTEILDLLRRLQEDLGLAILIVTHDLGVVADLCDRAVVLYAGQVVEEARVDDLLARPRHPYTEGLLASMPAQAERGVAMDTIRGTVPAPRDWARGCRFATRCPLATDECHESPIALRVEDGGRTRCIRVDALRTARSSSPSHERTPA